jgi:hypothetical protein
VSWLWGFLGLPILVPVAYFVFNLMTGRAAERAKLRDEGSAIVVPIKEFRLALFPTCVRYGALHGALRSETRFVAPPYGALVAGS